jgi:hypothetical protein
MSVGISAASDGSSVNLQIGGTDKLKVYQDGSVYYAGMQGWRNRIINGDMRIDQRNAGASAWAGLSIAGGYCLDRWSVWLANWITPTAAATVQRSTDVPAGQGFVNSLVTTVTTASSTSVVGSARYLIQQSVEGVNTTDLDWGTAAAKPITVSFWVKSSVTGTYGFSITNGPASRGLVSSYVVSQANTWERKTATILGDTTGEWLKDHRIGLNLHFDLGTVGPTTDTTNTWLTGDYRGLTSGVKLVNTAGATFYITGVQLEKGTAATPFDYVEYGEQLRRCQRYYEKSYDINVVPGTTTAGARDSGKLMLRGSGSASRDYQTVQYKVQKRAGTSATVLFYSTLTGSTGFARAVITGADYAATTNGMGDWSVTMQSNSTFPTGDQMEFHYTCSNEL